ncbi:hypothetical protein HYX58_01680 [Candidatus Dependentiae bacterium]|nr:hypothetical protein [Candidatus Dependentiae bacterium]
MMKLHLSLLAILITLSLMTQSALFSMEQSTNQSIVYHNANLRTVNGRLQMRVPSPTLLEDGTTTIEYQWVNATRIPAPCSTLKKQSH